MRIINECTSTNASIDRESRHGEALLALTQTAGRGQRGNTWESEPHKNITMSVMLRPTDLPAIRQFEISQAVALAVVDLLERLMIKDVKVKWPNDVYVGDKKICGILIENSLNGAMISRSIVGIGLNVNQTKFLSDAPNPVSIKQLTGEKEYDIIELANELIDNVLKRLGKDNKAEYRQRLWRGKGEWAWQKADGLQFNAEIVEVLSDGRLVLSNQPNPFAFKEVKPLGFAN